jgi:Putative Ig domain
MYKFFCCIALFLLISCSSEKSADIGTQRLPETGSGTARGQAQPSVSSESGSYSLAITPANATRNSTLRVVAQGFTVSEAEMEWLLNGHATASSNHSQFDARETQKGDKIQAKAIVQDKEVMSNIVEIKNAPPEITRVKILPEIFKSGDTLSVEVSANDIDGDDVAIAYEWTKNGEPAGKDKQLEAPVKRGDKIAVMITPFDGEVNGAAVILNREIKNMPPTIITDSKFHFDGKLFSYQIKAIDPDGDSLIYTLKQAPEGMVVDKTGLITWKASDKSRHAVTVQVTDAEGGEASYTFNVTLDSQQ